MAPEVAAFVALAVERLVALYKNLLEIRRLKTGMDDCGVPPENLQGVENHVDNVIKEGIGRFIEEEFDSHCKVKAKGRKNELMNATRIAMNKLANRIDKGYSLEVRVQSLSADDDAETMDKETVQQIEAIQKAAKGIEFIRLEGSPLLELPEAEKDGGDNDDTNA